MFFSPRSEGDHQLFLMPSVILSPLFAVNRSLPNHTAAIREGSGTAGRRIGSRVALNVLLILTLAGFTFFLTINYDKRAKGTDFPDFYTAARMVRDGYGHQLYDFKAQDRFQTVYAGRTGTYYIHPPFETLRRTLQVPYCFYFRCIVGFAEEKRAPRWLCPRVRNLAADFSRHFWVGLPDGIPSLLDEAE
jgi:hypothetical protein